MEDILRRSERVRQSSQATIERATRVTQRAGDLIGATAELNGKLELFDNLVDQIQSKMELE